MSWKFLSQINPLLGVDLGTSRTRIWCQGKGVVIDQPMMIATNTRTQKVIAIGQDAAEMEGRVQPQIKLHHPVKNGKIFDASAVKTMLQIWLQQILGLRYLLSPVIMVSVPAGCTQAGQQAVIETFYQLGAREVYTIAQPLAAAIGAGVPIADASGTLIFHLGAGVIEAGVISLGSLVRHQSSELAGNYFDQVLQKKILSQYRVELSLETIRELKHKLPLLNPTNQTIAVVGRSSDGRAPKEIEVKTTDLANETIKIVAGYSKLLESLLTEIYPELTADILDKGMLLSGGLAQLIGLDYWLADQLRIPTAVVENPDTAVIEGIKTALENLDDFKQSFGYQEAVG
jgi:rod shape-determining protein MreB and related proteins